MAVVVEPEAEGEKPRPRVRIADVSRALGLTKGTVSRALNGYPDISESTRQRVRAMADRMGYRPLSQAQGIRTGRTRSIGLVLQTSEHDSHAPFLTDFIAGVSDTASKHDWTLTVSTAGSDAAMATTLKRLVDERKADGFILPRTLTEDPRVRTLQGLDVPFVLFGRTRGSESCAYYDIKGGVAMQGAVRRLVGLGHRRIGFVGGGERYNFAALREAGYTAGLQEAGIEIDPALIQRNARVTAEGAAATRALLALPRPPTAIVFATDIAALGAYGVAEATGLTIGQDLSLIAYDGISAGAHMRPPLSTYQTDTHRAGAQLAELLIRLIRGEPATDLQVLEEARFIARQSDGPPRLSPSDIAARVAAHETAKTGQLREEPT